MTRDPAPEAGVYIVRPTGGHPARNINALTERLIEPFGQSPPIAKPVSVWRRMWFDVEKLLAQRRALPGDTDPQRQ